MTLVHDMCPVDRAAAIITLLVLDKAGSYRFIPWDVPTDIMVLWDLRCLRVFLTQEFRKACDKRLSTQRRTVAISLSLKQLVVNIEYDVNVGIFSTVGRYKNSATIEGIKFKGSSPLNLTKSNGINEMCQTYITGRLSSNSSMVRCGNPRGRWGRC